MAKKNWQTKEKNDIKRLGGRATPRSGGLWFAKGDSKNDTFLVDSKDSKHERYTITKKIWEKLEHEAILSDRLPMLSIKFGSKPIELVVMDINDFSGLTIHRK